MNMLLVTQLLYTMKMERRIDRAPFRPPLDEDIKGAQGSAAAGPTPRHTTTRHRPSYGIVVAKRATQWRYTFA